MIAALLSVLLLFGGTPPPLDEQLTFQSARPELRDRAIWVPASKLLGKQGQLRPDLLDERGSSLLSRIVYSRETKTQAALLRNGPCPGGYVDIGSDRLNPRPNDSLRDLAANALAIYRGRVERVIPGFFYGEPGSLLEVKVEHTIKDSQLYRPRPYLYVYYPFLYASVGDRVLCRASRQFPLRPASGDEVLVFAYDPPHDVAGTVLAPTESEIFIQPQGEPLKVPHGVRRDPSLTALSSLTELQAAVASELRDSDQPHNPRMEPRYEKE